MHPLITPEILAQVRALAIRKARTIPPRAGVTVDDLLGAGNLGLLTAAERYDATRGEFWPFAQWHVHGAMLDYLRSLDVRSRHELREAKKRGEEIQPIFAEAIETHADGLADTRVDLEAQAIRNERAGRVRAAIDELGEPARSILRGYWLEEKQAPEIARALNIPPRRVRETLARHERILRAKLRDLRAA